MYETEYLIIYYSNQDFEEVKDFLKQRPEVLKEYIKDGLTLFNLCVSDYIYDFDDDDSPTYDVFAQKIVKHLIKYYPESISYKDENGKTPLHHAMKNSIILEKLCLQLLEAGADLNATDNKGRTPMFNCITCLDEDLIENILGSYGSNIDLSHKNSNGYTLLDIAEAEQLNDGILYALGKVE